MEAQKEHIESYLRQGQNAESILNRLSDEERSLIPVLKELYLTELEGVTSYHRRLIEKCQRTVLFTTTASRLGIGFHTISPDNGIVLLEGLMTPFIVRAGGDNYRLIGPAFVNGVRNSEQCFASGADVRTITLV